MKPYILNYSEVIEVKSKAIHSAADTTRLTETIEQIDEGSIATDYSYKTEVKYNEEHTNLQGSTVQTFTVEPWDGDEITNNLHCSTLVTKSIEPSDNDEVNEMTTIVTRTIEQSDEDEIHQMSTLQTNTVESSDNNELLLN
ncbi:hypothetical protein KO527_11695 [Pseudoalteromonas sp. C2R02]|uniref:hypothetical protein n=1 Tax=Pseudoalteromonas sp. C2R02 TaxID=2841565 RepID=UPI001C089AE6|nr:hypothetical protein [Pseudoalteromonas sp. C2R02]MBU2970014.1 hypothetical protein [Pseudoalteromonas sp. C2R02]